MRGLIVGALRHALAGAGHRASTTVARQALSGFRPGFALGVDAAALRRRLERHGPLAAAVFGTDLCLRIALAAAVLPGLQEISARVVDR